MFLVEFYKVAPELLLLPISRYILVLQQNEVDSDDPVSWRKLQSIGQEVQNDLHVSSGVTVYRFELVDVVVASHDYVLEDVFGTLGLILGSHLQKYAVSVSLELYLVEGVFHKLVQVEILVAELKGAGLDLGQVQHIVDEVVEHGDGEDCVLEEGLALLDNVLLDEFLDEPF